MVSITRETTIADATEAALLEWIVASMPEVVSDRVQIGIGDDAAVLRSAGGVVLTTDTLVHGPDFRMAWSSAYDVGWKSAAVNLADVAAMGAEPTALLVALTLPGELTAGWVRDFYVGLTQACVALASDAPVAIVGGDVTVSATLTIAVTAVGDMGDVRPVTRAGAQVGDIIALAGEQGFAVHGLAILFDRFRDPDGHPVPINRDELSEEELFALDRQLRPQPPVPAGRAAARAGATALMDVSDGLLMDARRMARASGVQLDFHTAALGADPHAAINGGEDHTLLATFPVGVPLPDGFRAIGMVSAGPAVVTVDGTEVPERGGWDPYQDWDAELG